MSAPGCGSRRPPNIVRFRRFLATIIADRNKIIGLAIGPLSDHIAVLTPTQARIVDVGSSAVPRAIREGRTAFSESSGVRGHA